MNQITGSFILIVMCVVVVCAVSLRKRVEFLLNFMLRGISGCIAIFFINEMLTAQGADILVGINPLTALTSGILGLPGVALLYGVYLFRFL